MPEVLRAVSDYLCSGGDLGAEQIVRDEMTKLARLRREQGYDIDEILAEFEILGTILYDALREEARKFGRKVSPDYAVEVGERLYRALMVITTITATTFREEGFQDRRGRARLLGSFGRDLAHELRNRLSTAETALHVLGQEDLDGPTRERVLLALRRTVKRIEGVADDVHAWRSPRAARRRPRDGASPCARSSRRPCPSCAAWPRSGGSASRPRRPCPTSRSTPPAWSWR